MKWTVFFDLDGTLIDTSERHYRVHKDVLKSLGAMETLSKEEFWLQKRKGIKTLKFLPKDFSVELTRKFMSKWLERIEDKNYLKYDKFLPGTLEVLMILKKKYNLVLVTLRNNKKNLIWEVDKFGLANSFEEILVGSPLKLKNKVSLINDYIEKSSKNNFIIVGDTEADILAGKELELLTVAATYGIRSKEFLIKLKPDFLLDNFSDLHKVFKEIEVNIK